MTDPLPMNSPSPHPTDGFFWDHLPRPIIGLAPMDGVTDAAFRLMTARHGKPDVVFTEFIAVDRMVLGYDTELTDLRYSEAERPVVAQIFGTDPEAFYRAAHLIGELGFDGIDINMGCPSKNIARAGAGAGLIRTPELAVRILRKTRQGLLDWADGQEIGRLGLPAVVVDTIRRAKGRRSEGPEEGFEPPARRRLPLSVKTRLGYHRVCVEDWIPVLLSESPAAISIHGRTLVQHYRGEADWEAIGRAVVLARGTRTLILGNGDIRSPATAVERIRRTGVEGVLLGRAAMGNPWIFKAKEGIREAVRTGGPAPDEAAVSPAERLAMALEHARCFDRHRGKQSFRAMRKFLAAYCRGYRNAVETRRRLVLVEDLEELESLVHSTACV